MPIQGTLKAMPVPELMTWISQFSKTGTLEIRTLQSTITMAFESGALIYSSSSNSETTLGRLLIKHGVVTESMHQQARELRKTKSIAVAKALLELRMLTETQLLQFLRKKAEMDLFDLLTTEDGEFTFHALDLPQLELLPLRVDITRMLLRVSQHFDETGAYDFDSSGVRIEIAPDPEK
jgi:hypothetical protein